MADVYESYTTGDDDDIENSSSTYWIAQSFTPSVSHRIISVKLLVYRSGSGALPGTVTVSIRATSDTKPTGSDIDSVTGTTDGDTLPTAAPYEWREITLSNPISLTASTMYAIVVRCLGCSTNNYLSWRADFTSGAYADGNASISTNGGVAWSVSGMAGYDMLFEDRGDEVGGSTAPTVTTQECTNTIAQTSTGNGNLVSLGSAAVTAHGHCWNTTTNPTISGGANYLGAVDNGAIANTGQFSSAITDLTPSTKYYVRAFATNSNGTAYGANVEIAGDVTTIGRRYWSVQGEDFTWFGESGTRRKAQGVAMASDFDILSYL